MASYKLGARIVNNVSRIGEFKRMLYTDPNVIEIKVRSPNYSKPTVRSIPQKLGIVKLQLEQPV